MTYTATILRILSDEGWRSECVNRLEEEDDMAGHAPVCASGGQARCRYGMEIENSSPDMDKHGTKVGNYNVRQSYAATQRRYNNDWCPPRRRRNI